MAPLKLSPGRLAELHNRRQKRPATFGQTGRQLRKVGLSIGSRRPLVPSRNDAGCVDANALSAPEDRRSDNTKLTRGPDGAGPGLVSLTRLVGFAAQARHPLTGVGCPSAVDSPLAADRARLLAIVLVNSKRLREHLQKAFGSRCVAARDGNQSLMSLAKLPTHLLYGVFRRRLQRHEPAERVEGLLAAVVEGASENCPDSTEVPRLPGERLRAGCRAFVIQALQVGKQCLNRLTSILGRLLVRVLSVDDVVVDPRDLRESETSGHGPEEVDWPPFQPVAQLAM